MLCKNVTSRRIIKTYRETLATLDVFPSQMKSFVFYQKPEQKLSVCTETQFVKWAISDKEKYFLK